MIMGRQNTTLDDAHKRGHDRKHDNRMSGQKRMVSGRPRKGFLNSLGLAWTGRVKDKTELTRGWKRKQRDRSAKVPYGEETYVLPQEGGQAPKRRKRSSQGERKWEGADNGVSWKTEQQEKGL